eukprot:Gb_04437 [translate_table: standard]
MAIPASMLTFSYSGSCLHPPNSDSRTYNAPVISGHLLLQAVTCLVKPFPRSRKKNGFSVLRSACYVGELKYHRGDIQCKCCGRKQYVFYVEASMFLASTLLLRAEQLQPSGVGGLLNSCFSINCINISKNGVWKRSGKQYFRPFMGRRYFFSLASICLGALLTIYAPSASADSGREGKRSPYDEQRLLEQNKRMQKVNNVPPDFPNFVREGFDVKVVTSDNYVRCDSGLIYWDIKEGEGDYPKSGQQVVFDYTGYNESGRRIDSSYQQGSPAKTRIGISGLVPGFEEGIRTMKPGGKRRIIVPPELGPPGQNFLEGLNL